MREVPEKHTSYFGHIYGGSFRTYHSNIYFLLSQAKENVVLFSQVKINPLV